MKQTWNRLRTASFGLAAAGLGLVIVVEGCSDASKGPPGGPAVQRSIGPEGGTVTVDGVTLAIPPNALAQSTSIAIHAEAPSRNPPGYAIDGKVYRFEPEGLVFQVPVIVTFPRSASQSSVFWTAAASSDRFELLTTTRAEGTASAAIHHFSRGFAGEQIAASGECSGPETQPCGACGTQTRTCNGDVWSEWSACIDEGVCVPNTTRACGAGGTEVCSMSCGWGLCNGSNDPTLNAALDPPASCTASPTGGPAATGHTFAQAWGCGGRNGVNSVVTDRAGNIYLAFMFQGTLDLGTGPRTSAGDDVLVAKLDPTGKPLWTKRLGGPGQQLWPQLMVGPSDEIVISFTNSGTVDAGVGPLAAQGTSLVLVKADPSGTTVWQKQFGTPAVVYKPKLRAGPQGRIAIAGAFTGTLAFGTTPLVQQLSIKPTGFLAALDSDGNHVFSQTFSVEDDQSWVQPSGLAVDGGTGAIALVGIGRGTVDLGKGPLVFSTVLSTPTDCFVARFDAGGVAQWTQRWINCNPRDLDVNANGELLVTGSLGPNSSTFGGLGTRPPGTLNAKIGPNGTATYVNSSANATFSLLGVRANPNGEAVLFGSNQGCYVKRYNAAGAEAGSINCGTGSVGAEAGHGLDYLSGAFSPNGSLVIGGVFEGTNAFGGVTLSSLLPQAFVASIPAP